MEQKWYKILCFTVLNKIVAYIFKRVQVHLQEREKINDGSVSFQVLQKSEYDIGKICFHHSCLLLQSFRHRTNFQLFTIAGYSKFIYFELKAHQTELKW